MAGEPKKDLNFKYNYGKPVRKKRKKVASPVSHSKKKPVHPMGLGVVALRNLCLFLLSLAILAGFFLLGTEPSENYEQVLAQIFQDSTWKWIAFGILMLLGGVYAIYETKERDWFSEEGLTSLTILYAASLLATAFGCMIVVLLGESMYQEGGIAQLIVKLSGILTAVSALIFLVATLLPVLLDRNFLYGLSVFLWKLVIAFVVGMIVFGIGALLYEIMEVYQIVHTVLVIGMVALLIFLFFAFVGFCASHSVIAKCFVDVSVGVLGTAAEIGEAWYDSIDWEATKKERERIQREAEAILKDDGT